MDQEQAVLRTECPKCGFHFPYMIEQPSSFGVFKDLAGADGASNGQTNPAVANAQA
jgi:hypothetical protein